MSEVMLSVPVEDHDGAPGQVLIADRSPKLHGEPQGVHLAALLLATT